MGFRGQDLGFGLQDLGLGLGLGFRVQDLGFRIVGVFFGGCLLKADSTKETSSRVKCGDR